MKLLKPKEFEEQGRLLYCPTKLAMYQMRSEFRRLPIKIACGGYLIMSDILPKRSIGSIIEVRAFPPRRIENIVQIPEANMWSLSFSRFDRGTNEITKVSPHFQTFYFFRDPDKKAYELAQVCVNKLEERVDKLKLEEKRNREVIKGFKQINSRLYYYLRDLEKMDCQSWLEYLRVLSEKNPLIYEDFMRKAMTPVEREYIKKLNENPLTLGEFFTSAPENEAQLREIFNKFHHLFGFRIIVDREAYPDYILCRNNEEIRAEAELYSSRFIEHKHNPKECDMIICWEHNINRDCPSLDIFEVGTGKIYKKDGTISKIIISPEVYR